MSVPSFRYRFTRNFSDLSDERPKTNLAESGFVLNGDNVIVHFVNSHGFQSAGIKLHFPDSHHVTPWKIFEGRHVQRCAVCESQTRGDVPCDGRLVHILTSWLCLDQFAD